MNIQRIAAALLLFSLIPFTGAAAADLEDGFMGYVWGEDISNYEGLQELYRKGGITYYANPGQSYQIEGKTIGDVIYGFYNDKFYAVYINIDSPLMYELVKQHMKANYGLPDNKTSAASDIFTYKWKYRDVSIKLKTDQDNSSMKVAFYHEPTARGLKKEQALRELEASDRFFPIEKNEKIDMVPFLQSWDMR